MSEKCSITSSMTGKTYATANGNCKSKRLIYAATCRICCKQYTGKTDDQVRSRVCGHRTHVNSARRQEIIDESDIAALADHLRDNHNLVNVDDFNNSYVFTILELDPSNLDKCEQKWVSRLVTMSPFGLNIEKPCGVSDSILAMSTRSQR